MPICLLYLLFSSFMRVREWERDYSGELTCNSCSGQQGSVSGSLQHCSSSASTVNLSSKQFLCWIHRIVRGEYCATLTQFLYLFRRTSTSNTSAALPAHFLTVKTWFNLQFHFFLKNQTKTDSFRCVLQLQRIKTDIIWHYHTKEKSKMYFKKKKVCFCHKKALLTHDWPCIIKHGWTR